jgi:peptide/nickel transport system substrate-binding protein
MAVRLGFVNLVAIVAILAIACQAPQPRQTQAPGGSGAAPAAPAAQTSAPGAAGPTRVSVAVTETVEKVNPYADSVALLYGIWCSVFGCLVSYDADKGDYVGALAESWEVVNSTTWVFHLRQDVKWHDGSPFTAADVVHSFDRIRDDPASRQKRIFSVVGEWTATDDYTVRITTKGPTAELLDYFADRLIITNKAQFDQYGEAVWDQTPIGTGPYMFVELVPNQRLIVKKNPDWWGGPVQGPDEVVFRVMREPEVRVTALLNGEVQIAQFIPPHMADRVNNGPNTKTMDYDSLELMFLAMQPKPPFDNKLVRQAVCYAIDRDAIIQGVLMGKANKLEGPIGPGQYGYNPELRPRYDYDPDKARQLLAQAGYPNGVDVNLYTPVGRYIQDKQITEAMTSMLSAAGIRTTLHTPEWPTLWANVQDGKVGFYYMGRGSVQDPGPPLSQYFETGVSKRVAYSNPTLDALFKKERAAFDPAERKRVLSELMSLLTEEAPACFMWRHRMTLGLTKNVDYPPPSDDRIYPQLIRVR